jgi:hypothetical protein
VECSGHVVLGHLHRHMCHLQEQPVRAKHRVPGQPNRCGFLLLSLLLSYLEAILYVFGYRVWVWQGCETSCVLFQKPSIEYQANPTCACCLEREGVLSSVCMLEGACMPASPLNSCTYYVCQSSILSLPPVCLLHSHQATPKTMLAPSPPLAPQATLITPASA